MSFRLRPLLAEISKVQLAERVAKLIETCAESATVHAIFGAVGTAGMTVAFPALMLVGMELFGTERDGTRAEGFEEHCKDLAEMLRSLDLRLDSVAEHFEQMRERRAWVWARLSGGDQALLAKRTAKAMKAPIAEMLQCHHQAAEQSTENNRIYLEELLHSFDDFASIQTQAVNRIENAQAGLATAEHVDAARREILDRLSALLPPPANGNPCVSVGPAIDNAFPTSGLSDHARANLYSALDGMIRQNGIQDLHPSVAAQHLQHATEEEAVHGIISAGSFLDHELADQHELRRLILVVPPVPWQASVSSPPPDVHRIPPTRAVVPVSLVASYVLLEFARQAWRIPLNTQLISTVSGLPLLRVLETQRPDIAIIPSIMFKSLTQSSIGAEYPPLTVLCHGTQALIAPAHERIDLRHLQLTRSLDVVCVGLKTPQRFLRGLGRVGIVDNRRLSATSIDPAADNLVQNGGSALRSKYMVAAFFPVNAIFPAIGLGAAIPLDRLPDSRASHLLLARRDLAENPQWSDLLARTLHAARDCLENDTRFCRTFVQGIIASDAYVNALMTCLK